MCLRYLRSLPGYSGNLRSSYLRLQHAQVVKLPLFFGNTLRKEDSNGCSLAVVLPEELNTLES
jgi:hypothetical protein